SLAFFGIGQLLILSILAGSVWIPLLEMRCPKKPKVLK
ncbi:hypothetical protein JL09_g7057, partial [Pichia kudriavzevii]